MKAVLINGCPPSRRGSRSVFMIALVVPGRKLGFGNIGVTTRRCVETGIMRSAVKRA
jgi:hypothetical protein